IKGATQPVTVAKASNPVSTSRSKAATRPSPSLIPLPVEGCKIPFTTRIKYLKMFANELQRKRRASTTSPDETVKKEALKIEEEICLKCKNLQLLYSSLSASKIRSIRAETDDDADQKKSRQSAG